MMCGRHMIANAAMLFFVLALVPAIAAVPEPNAIVDGSGAAPFSPGTTIEARIGNDVVAAYVVGSVSEAGDSYILPIPMETLVEAGELRTPNTAKFGDVFCRLPPGR